MDTFRSSVQDQLTALDCRNQGKKLAALEMELTAAKSQGFGRKSNITTSRLHAVVGVMTSFGTKNRRDAIRNSWMPKGEALKRLEREHGIIIRFVIGRSANRGDMSDRRLDIERAEHDDFLILEDHVESEDALSLKSKFYFSVAVEQWDADFYVKVDDNVFVNIDILGATLAKHRGKPRVYLGCMKTGIVVSDSSSQWYEPEWWKFGDENSQYYLHASGQIYTLSKALAQYININSASLHAYKNEDISVGAWMLGLDVEHADDSRFCCVSSLLGSICTTRP
jgi:galactosylxylosylprotein 3-beta-galactosyltransferase